MAEFTADVCAEMPNAVMAMRRLAEDERTRDLTPIPAGGSWRRIQITIEADDRGFAYAEAIRLLRDERCGGRGALGRADRRRGWEGR